MRILGLEVSYGDSDVNISPKDGLRTVFLYPFKKQSFHLFQLKQLLVGEFMELHFPNKEVTIESIYKVLRITRNKFKGYIIYYFYADDQSLESFFQEVHNVVLDFLLELNFKPEVALKIAINSGISNLTMYCIVKQ